MVYLLRIQVYTCHQFIDVTSCTGMLDMSVGDEHTQTVSASAASDTEQEADPEPPQGK